MSDLNTNINRSTAGTHSGQGERSARRHYSLSES